MDKVAIIGAGKIGAAIAKLLMHSDDYQLVVIDGNRDSLMRLPASHRVNCQCLQISDRPALKSAVDGCAALISSCPFHESLAVAELALEIGASYFDLTEDNVATEAIEKLAKKSRPGQVFIPQCGLAPGFVVILANHISQQFEALDSLKLRVGALPQYPSNLMMYNLSWSTEGLINEYCNPCHAIHQGKLVDLIPLEGLENFSLDAMDYEAFNTSGGLGTLCRSMLGKTQELSYKTIRYRGHQYLMDFLINGLKLGERRQLLKEIFENAVAITKQDVVVIMVAAAGCVDGQFTQITESRKIYHRDVYGEHWGAIQITTAASICAVIDLFFRGDITQQGFVRQESIDYQAFISNRFGQYYQQ